MISLLQRLILCVLNPRLFIMNNTRWCIRKLWEILVPTSAGACTVQPESAFVCLWWWWCDPSSPGVLHRFEWMHSTLNEYDECDRHLCQWWLQQAVKARKHLETQHDFVSLICPLTSFGIVTWVEVLSASLPKPPPPPPLFWLLGPEMFPMFILPIPLPFPLPIPKLFKGPPPLPPPIIGLFPPPLPLCAHGST